MATATLTSVLQQLRTIAHAKAYEDTSDRDLLERFVVQREEAAFVALLKRHGPMVLQVCRRAQGNEHDAEDVFQATFLLLARKAGSIYKPESLASWLHGAANRLALEARKQDARRQAREKRAADMRRTSGVCSKTPADLQAALDDALRLVPVKYRTPLLLCYLEGKTQEETARQLGCPIGTVRSRLARGRDRLREVLQRKGVCLTASAIAAALAESNGSATAPIPLLMATARAAVSYVAGKAAAALLSARGAALLDGGLKTMLIAKLKIAAAIVVIVGVLGVGAGGVATHVLAGLLQANNQDPRSGGSVAMKTEDKERPVPSRGVTDKESRQAIVVRGRVIDPAGKPVAGAKLFVPRARNPEPVSDEDVVMDTVGAADADGRFKLSIKPPGIEQFYLAAYVDGFGLEWVNLNEQKTADEIVFCLPKDVPITGQVVNTEGKPVAGVSVSSIGIQVPANDKLDDYLSGWLSNLTDTLSGHRRMFGPLDGITSAVKTDKDGKFTVRGAGAERIITLILSGGGVARSMLHVVTRPGLDPKPYNDVLLKKDYEYLRVLNRFLGLYPPAFTFIAEAGKTVEGVIKDAASGKPLPGCRLFVSTGWGDGIHTISDANGHYRLDGLAKSDRGYGISVVPPKGSTGYINRTANAADTDGYTPVKLDIELAKGALVTGRVLDKQTGKGIRAGVRLAPLPDNRFFASKPGFDNYKFDSTMQPTEKDGRFRLMTIPGKALLMVQALGGEKVHDQNLNPYRRAVADPDHKDLFKYDADDDTWIIPTGKDGRVEILSTEQAVKVVDIKEGAETHVELYVDRGVTGRLAVQDSDGNPLAGAWVAGLTDSWPITYKLPEPTATVYALNPAKPRTLAVFHPNKKLGGAVTIRADEKEPVVVKLGPVGKVTGRLLEADGTPLIGATVSIAARSMIVRELYRFATPEGKPVLTDKDGRFTLSGVVPGVSFYVQTQKGESFFASKPKIGVLQLKPGETLDLGDRTMELMR
jgi:RNA polymerase sigma factor (sigma-70 family)